MLQSGGRKSPGQWDPLCPGCGWSEGRGMPTELGGVEVTVTLTTVVVLSEPGVRSKPLRRAVLGPS